MRAHGSITRWSAEVTPERVFSLLEAVFGEFDAAARRLGVFKVETIGAATRQMLMLRACFVLAADLFFLYLFMVAGDCYLAVTGLPEPNARHAEAMADRLTRRRSRRERDAAATE
jgi:class 3 adenylate cyclase